METTQTPHLRPVDQGDPESPDSQRRASPRQRAGKSLPTDRMKMEVQIRVLQSLGRISGPGKRPVTNQMLAQAVEEVSHYTVGLSNNFFVDVGWLDKRGRGEYAASDALIDYTRRLAADPAHAAAAIEPLRKAMEASWVWRAIRPILSTGSAPLSEVRLILMQEAEAGQDHLQHLNNLIEWLRYANLITVANDRVIVVGQIAPDAAPVELSEEVAGDPAEARVQGQVTEPEIQPADTKGKGTTGKPPAEPGVMVAFDLSFTLSAADLAKLSPEQIKALFDGIGAVMAVRNALS